MSDTKSHALILGVTGGIACGKSEVGRILEKMGFNVCDADHVAHELMKKGTPVFLQVVDHFGTRILMENGEISRPALGQIVFDASSELTELNRMVHPAVRDALNKLISENRRNEKNTAVLIPLLFESGMETLDWDFILCVSSSEELMLQRLEKRGLSRAEAECRVRTQMPLKEKETKAGFTIPNTGTLEELEQQTHETINRLLATR